MNQSFAQVPLFRRFVLAVTEEVELTMHEEVWVKARRSGSLFCDKTWFRAMQLGVTVARKRW